MRFVCAGLSTLRPYRTRSAQLDGWREVTATLQEEQIDLPAGTPLGRAIRAGEQQADELEGVTVDGHERPHVGVVHEPGRYPWG